jgi:hypothetical protein
VIVERADHNQHLMVIGGLSSKNITTALASVETFNLKYLTMSQKEYYKLNEEYRQKESQAR